MKKKFAHSHCVCPVVSLHLTNPPKQSYLSNCSMAVEGCCLSLYETADYLACSLEKLWDLWVRFGLQHLDMGSSSLGLRLGNS